jgi:hypothetical protein
VGLHGFGFGCYWLLIKVIKGVKRDIYENMGIKKALPIR